MMYYNESFDTVIIDDSVDEALGQRGQKEKKNDTKLTLEHCLGEYGNVETLSDDYKCDECNEKGTTKSKIDIWRLPDILIIHMKRFVYTMYVRGKLNNLVSLQTKKSKFYDYYDHH
jgi:ubiquitin carboxyl-terminal hydrolase 15